MRRAITPTAVLVCLVLTPLVPRAHGYDEPDPALQAYLGANGMLNRGLFELAAEEYRQFLSNHEDHEKVPVARYGLGVSLFRMGKHEAAIEALAPLSGVSRFTFAAEVGTILGQCYVALKKYPEAAKAFQVVVRKHSDHALADEAGAGRAEALYLAGKYADTVDAVQYFADHWGQSPLRTRTEFFGGLASMARKNFGDAAERFSRLLKRDDSGPFTEQASFLLAQCYQQNNAIDAAIRQYDRVLEQARSRYLPDALLSLAGLLQQQGESRKAGSHLDRLLKKYPDGSLVGPAHLQRGRSWFDQGRYDRAFEQFELADREGGSLADSAAYWMAKCKLRQGDFTNAANRLKHAIDEYPLSDLIAEMYYDRAIALVRAAEHEQAVDALRAFRERFSDHQLSAEALQLLAVTEHQRRRYDESQEYSRAFLEAYPSHNLASSVAFLFAENEFLAQRFEQAVDAYRRFLSEHEGDAQSKKATYRLGTALYRLERFEQAREPLSDVTDGEGTEEVYRSALLALGDMAFQRGEWKTSEKHFTDYLSAGLDIPSADDALLKLGLSLQRQQRHEEALRLFDRLMARFDDSPHRLQAMFERGQVLVSLSRLDEAADAFQSVVDQQRDSRFAPHALNHLASLATQRGDYEAAAKLYEGLARSTSEDDMNADALFRHAQSLLASKHYPDAEQAFDRFIETHGSHANAPEARARRAIAIARQNRYEDAVAAIEEAQSHGSSSLDAQLLSALRYENAWCLRELGRTDEAARAYGGLVEDGSSEESNVHAMLELSGIQVSAERFEEASGVLKRLRQAVRGGTVEVPKKVREQATYRLGVCEFELGNLRESAELFDEFVEDFPKSDLLASASFYAGEALFQLGRHDKATAHLSRVAERFEDDPVYAPSLLRLGESLAALQRWSRSERVFTDYLDRFASAEHWYQAKYGIGWARENQRRHDEAISAYREVVERHQGPTAARAQFQIGECLFAKKQYSEAVRELLKVDILYAYPQWSAAALFEAGRCFEKLGKTVEARAQFTRVSQEHKQTRWAVMATQRLSELTSAMMPGR